MKRSTNKTSELVYGLAKPIADELGLTIWDIRFEKEGAMWVLLVVIDKEGGVSIDKLCIGNMHVAPGKEVTGDVHVYMDEKDKEDLRAIRAKGVDVYIQIAPGDHKLDFEK